MRFLSLADKNARVSYDVLVHNVQGATISLGLPAVYCTNASSLGKVVLPATNNTRAFAGLTLKDLPDNEIGLVRAYGLHNSVAVYAHGTSVSIPADAAMGVGPASLGVAGTGLTIVIGPVINLTSVGASITSAGGYTSGFVKAM